MTFGNAGGWPAAGVVITSTVSVPTLTQVSIVSSGVAITTTTAPVYTWQVQDLAPDQGGVITLTGLVSPTLIWHGWLTNTAGITSTGEEISAANNSAVVSVEIGPYESFLPVILKAQ